MDYTPDSGLREASPGEAGRPPRVTRFARLPKAEAQPAHTVNGPGCAPALQSHKPALREETSPSVGARHVLPGRPG